MKKPLCIDLFSGLGGWSEGFLSEGYECIGFDIERHVYGEKKYPAQLVLQDVLTLHGSQFKDATCIVASPPCQTFSWMAMPWSLAKAKAAWYRECASRRAELAALFDACFRIQREAIEEAGRHIPLIVENVRGAQPWVGRAPWNYGSFYLWGDVPALMPFTRRALKTIGIAYKRDGHSHTRHLTNQRESDALKVPGINWNGYGEPGYKAKGFNVTAAQRFRAERDGVKNGNDWFGPGANCSLQRKSSSRSDSRKAASAEIAKIPFELSSHIARCFHPGTAYMEAAQ